MKYYKENNLLIACNDNETLIGLPNAIEITKAEYDIHKQIQDLKAEIRTTDYIACKLAEVDGDDKTALKQEYATQLARRNEIRALINELEAQL